jgi:hypothetical protein
VTATSEDLAEIAVRKTDLPEYTKRNGGCEAASHDYGKNRFQILRGKHFTRFSIVKKKKKIGRIELNNRSVVFIW